MGLTKRKANWTEQSRELSPCGWASKERYMQPRFFRAKLTLMHTHRLHKISFSDWRPRFKWSERWRIEEWASSWTWQARARARARAGCGAKWLGRCEPAAQLELELDQDGWGGVHQQSGHIGQPGQPQRWNGQPRTLSQVFLEMSGIAVIAAINMKGAYPRL